METNKLPTIFLGRAMLTCSLFIYVKLAKVVLKI